MKDRLLTTASTRSAGMVFMQKLRNTAQAASQPIASTTRGWASAVVRASIIKPTLRKENRMRDERFGGGFAVRGLGEVAIGCRDLPTMARFYGEVLGLERLAGRDGIARFRIAEAGGGPGAALALIQAEAAA